MIHKFMLGGNIFGYFTNASETNELLHFAKDFVRAIDTADVYSGGLSEQFIGKAIKKDRQDWFIASKAGLQSHGNPEGLGKKKTIFAKVEESLKRLDTDYLDLYQIHHFDPATPLEETIEAFDLLIRQGKIRSAGISNFDAQALDLLKENAPHCFRFHQMALNIQFASDAQARLSMNRNQKMQTIAYSALARGLFDEKYLNSAQPAHSRAAVSSNVRKDLTPEFLCSLHRMSDIAQAYSTTLSAIALAWLHSFQEVSWVIVGCRAKKQIRNCFEALRNPPPKKCLIEAEALWRRSSYYRIHAGVH